VNSFVPERRAEHNAILVNKKLYFYGGWVTGGINRFPNNTLFYLDVSIPFTISDMPWTDLSSIIGVINRTGASACIDKIFNTSIFFIGGNYENTSAPINKFDTTTQQWSTPVISGSTPLPNNLKFVPCISLNDGIYIYGGNTSLSTMNKLDTLKLSWSILSSSISATKTQGYSAILLNESILYIGGTNQLAPDGWNCPNKTSNLMEELPLYDINNNNWSKVKTSGKIPLERCGHSSVFVSQHNRILLFYGEQDISDVSPIALDTLTFAWSIPNISNTGIGGPQQILRWHSSTLIGAYVLIAFGYLYPTTKRTSSSDIFLLDVSRADEYKWVTSYDPNKTFQPITTTSYDPAKPTTTLIITTNNINIGTIIGITIGIVGLLLLAIIAILIFRNKYTLLNTTSLKNEVTDHQPA
ncbi:27512_t:CDS:2, partial [Gigaspora margarita]